MHQDSSALDITSQYPCPELYKPITETTAPRNLENFFSYIINGKKPIFLFLDIVNEFQ